MSSPSDLRYTETHEWIRVSGDTATLGITKFAVDELTDVTFVQMKKAGTKLKKGDQVGEVESVKATSDIYSPIAGTIVEVNTQLEDDASKVNAEPYGAGWLVKIKPDNPADASALLDAAAYDAKYGG